MQQQYSIAIGIPTCYGGKSLLKAIKSIIDTTTLHINLYVVADNIPFTESEKKQLEKMNVQFKEYKGRRTQISKLQEIISLVKEDIFIFTQDDIRFNKKTVASIYESFVHDKKITMIGTKVAPEISKKHFERILEIGYEIVLNVIPRWNNGDNYLAANGRCLAFKTSFIKKLKLNPEIVNTDAYFYLENKFKKGKFLFLPTAIVFNKSAEKISEFLNQRRRFLSSKTELETEYKTNLDEIYALSKAVLIRAVLTTFFKRPFLTMQYFLVILFAKIFLSIHKGKVTALWALDFSTKR